MTHSLTDLLTGVKCRATSVAKKLSNVHIVHCTVAWVTRPERPKGVKDAIKQVGARRAPRLLVISYWRDGKAVLFPQGESFHQLVVLSQLKLTDRRNGDEAHC